jgi:hypothetical protein
MKFYNPFKAHIVQFDNGKYAVRRWCVAWEYKEHITLSNEDIYWWNTMEYAKRWCMVDTLEQAQALRDKVHVKKSNANKVVKVHG